MLYKDYIISPPHWICQNNDNSPHGYVNAEATTEQVCTHVPRRGMAFYPRVMACRPSIKHHGRPYGWLQKATFLQIFWTWRFDLFKTRLCAREPKLEFPQRFVWTDCYHTKKCPSMKTAAAQHDSFETLLFTSLLNTCHQSNHTELFADPLARRCCIIIEQLQFLVGYTYWWPLTVLDGTKAVKMAREEEESYFSYLRTLSENTFTPSTTFAINSINLDLR